MLGNYFIDNNDHGPNSRVDLSGILDVFISSVNFLRGLIDCALGV